MLNLILNPDADLDAENTGTTRGAINLQRNARPGIHGLAREGRHQDRKFYHVPPAGGGKQAFGSFAA
jgi:hypothetical protein